MNRKEIANMFNITILKVKRVEVLLNIKGETIKGKRVYNEEESEMIIKYLRENHTLPKDAVLIENTESDYITPRGEVYKKKGGVYFKAKLDTNWQGYNICAINYKDGRKNQRIHRLVATYFLEKPKDKNFVNHINGIKTDNTLQNLEWVTESENMKHAVDNGLLINDKAFDDSQSKSVTMYDVKTNEIIEVFGSIRDASRQTNIKLSTIAHQVKTKCKPRKHKVYFRYSEE